jgi:hypothetical protein
MARIASKAKAVRESWYTVAALSPLDAAISGKRSRVAVAVVAAYHIRADPHLLLATGSEAAQESSSEEELRGLFVRTVLLQKCVTDRG